MKEGKVIKELSEAQHHLFEAMLAAEGTLRGKLNSEWLNVVVLMQELDRPS